VHVDEGFRNGPSKRSVRERGRITSNIRTATQHRVDAVSYLADAAGGPDPGLPTLLA
jgi:hypothetical protein